MEFHVGQILTMKKSYRARYIGSYYSTSAFDGGFQVTVTKAGPSSIWLRGETTVGDVRTLPFAIGDMTEETLADWFEEAVLDPNAPKPRKLGEVPEDGIAPDDPRIAWLWEDAAKLATRQGHCSTYDKMCDSLGIPGRPRQFTVKRNVNGFDISKKFTATSKKLAESMFDAELKEAIA